MCISFFGLDRVKANYVNVTNEVSRKIAGRQLNNIEKAINEIAQRNASWANISDFWRAFAKSTDDYECNIAMSQLSELSDKREV